MYEIFLGTVKTFCSTSRPLPGGLNHINRLLYVSCGLFAFFLCLVIQMALLMLSGDPSRTFRLTDLVYRTITALRVSDPFQVTLTLLGQF